MMPEINKPTLIKTNADEFYFPSRLIYRIESMLSVLKQLDKLHCIYKHPTQKRWMIECSGEALKFNQWSEYYTKAISNKEPLILAYFNFPSNLTMHVYMRAFARVTPTLKLLDAYLPRSIAVGTHHDVCFKLVTVNNNNEIPAPEKFFSDESKIYYPENMRQVDLLEDQARLTGKDYSKQIKAIFKEEFRKALSRPALIHDLERKRLESFYIDGADEYSGVMKMQEKMGLARHLAGGKLDARKFFEQVLKDMNNISQGSLS